MLAAAGLLAFVYLAVVTIDPWNVLPASPPLPRVPVSSNARFTMPSLARSPAFDSAVIGSSSSRLLRPTLLDQVFGGHFVNLSMNAATAWEQHALLMLFIRRHPDASSVIIGLDNVWCAEQPQRSSGRPFPAWMYNGSPWRGYGHMLSLYAVQEAGNQLWTLLRSGRARYGLDGYTSFVPPEAAYDPVRVAAAFARWGKPPDIPAAPGPHVIPTLPMLAELLRALPPGTSKILFFTPGHVSVQGAPGSDYAAMLDSCRAQVVALARATPNAVVADFLRPSPITRTTDSYWDPVHYRLPIADRVVQDLARATKGEDTPDDVVLWSGKGRTE